ncbi:unnamed protein product [Effrenium voratum]|nr:unnamed protein product [Effrenium voratum]
MGKKNKDSDSDKKKKKKKDKKKDKKKKEKKDKKKKAKSSSSSSSSAGEAAVGLPVEPNAAAAAPELNVVNMDALPALEEGILRFEFSSQEQGPLGLRFSGGSPPMILHVAPGSFADKKSIPTNHEVHAINGLALLPQNQQRVMQSLKGRPVVLDVRPLGWKPPEKLKELKRKHAQEEAERQAKMAVEKKRREQEAKKAAEEAERQAAERAVREEKERQEREEMLARAREVHKEQREKEEEFRKALNSDPVELRKAADDLMEAEYGSGVKEGVRLPLRLLTRRKEVAWIWAGEVMELIGGGAPDDTFTQ